MFALDSQPLVVVDKCVISVLAKASLKMCVLRPNVLCCLETLVLQLIERHHIPRCSDYDQFEKICETLQQECGSFFNPCEKLFMEAQFLVRTPDVSENQLSFVGNKLQRIFGLAHVSKVDPFIRRIERILLPDMPELAIQVFLQGAAHIQLANCSDGPNCTKLRMLDNQKAARASLIAAARAVTHLSFGAENPDCLTDSIIDMILEEPEAFKQSLKKHLAEGFSYVEARARAADGIIPGSGHVLAGSNNTLALAYMARIKKKSYALAPLPVLREGAAYNSEKLEEISSAAAIRRALRDGRTDEAFASMPEASARIFKRALADGRLCLDYENWRRLLRALLLRARPEELRGFAEISEGIE